MQTLYERFLDLVDMDNDVHDIYAVLSQTLSANCLGAINFLREVDASPDKKPLMRSIWDTVNKEFLEIPEDLYPKFELVAYLMALDKVVKHWRYYIHVESGNGTEDLTPEKLEEIHEEYRDAFYEGFCKNIFVLGGEHTPVLEDVTTSHSIASYAWAFEHNPSSNQSSIVLAVISKTVEKAYPKLDLLLAIEEKSATKTVHEGLSYESSFDERFTSRL